MVGAGQHQLVALLLQLLPGEQPIPPLILHPQGGDHRLRQTHQPHQHRIGADAFAGDCRLYRAAADRQAGAIAVFGHGDASLDREGGGLGHGGSQGNAQAHVVEGGAGITGVGRSGRGGAQDLVARGPGGLAAGELAERAGQGQVDAAEATGQGHQFTRIHAAVAVVKPELQAGPIAIGQVDLAVQVGIELGQGIQAAGGGAAAITAAEVFRQHLADRGDLAIAIAIHHDKGVVGGGALGLGLEPGSGEGQA